MPQTRYVMELACVLGGETYTVQHWLHTEDLDVYVIMDDGQEMTRMTEIAILNRDEILVRFPVDLPYCEIHVVRK